MSHKKPHLIRQFRRLKLRFLLILTLLLALLAIGALRSNNEHMLKLRNNVFSADKADLNVAQSLQALQAYVTTHMNTNLSTGSGSIYPPIQLKYTYDRLLADESSSAAQANDGLYTAAQNYCQSQIPTGFSGRYRVPCIEQYVQAHDSSLPAIPDALYKFNFVSPSWSPDLAGWSVVALIILIALCLTSLTLKLI